MASKGIETSISHDKSIFTRFDVEIPNWNTIRDDGVGLGDELSKMFHLWDEMRDGMYRDEYNEYLNKFKRSVKPLMFKRIREYFKKYDGVEIDDVSDLRNHISSEYNVPENLPSVIYDYYVVFRQFVKFYTIPHAERKGLIKSVKKLYRRNNLVEGFDE